MESPSNANIDAVSPEAVGTNPLKADSSNTDTDECSSGIISNSVSAPLYTCMVTAARMFDKRARNLIHDLIITAANIIGDVVDFYFQIEFQQRGKLF